MDLEQRIREAEADLNDALAHTRDIELARRQVVEALDDVRVYRNLLALQPFGVPRDPSRPLIPQQQRRRVRPATDPVAPPGVPDPPVQRRNLSVASAYREALIGPQTRRRP